MSRILVSALLASSWIAACAATPQPEAPASSALDTAESPGRAGSQAARATSSGPVAPADPATAAPDRRRDLALPLGWDTLPIAAFEEALAPWNPDGAPGRLSPDALAQLGLALDGESARGLRAVLLLASSAAPEARDVLVGRLERRIRTATKAFPAVDVAAAAALGVAFGPEDAFESAPADAAQRARAAARSALAGRLDQLARGPRPHPLFVVRVECAAASLALGRSAATTFLLVALREGTPRQDPRPTWVRAALSIDELTFAQWRASEALAQRAGIANPYRPELSAFERERIAGEMERVLAARALELERARAERAADYGSATSSASDDADGTAPSASDDAPLPDDGAGAAANPTDVERADPAPIPDGGN
jgi:hypothetical protein